MTTNDDQGRDGEATVDPDRIASLTGTTKIAAERIRELEHQVEVMSTQLSKANLAIQSRDVIGMAKGIIIATVGCSPDAAFDILVAQSSVEHRKVIEIARETVRRNERRRGVVAAAVPEMPWPT